MYETLDEAIAASGETTATMELQDRSPVGGRTREIDDAVDVDDEPPKVKISTI